MRSSGLFFVLFLVVAAVFLNNTDVDCKATIEKIEEEAAGEGKQVKESGGGSESWAEWVKDKLYSKSDDDQIQDNGNTNQDKAGCVKEAVKDKTCESAEEAKKKAAEDKAKEGYEAAKSKAEKTYESGKEKLSQHQEL